MAQVVKLKDFLRELQIPLHLRDALPVIEVVPATAGEENAPAAVNGDPAAATSSRVANVAAVYPGAVGAGYHAVTGIEGRGRGDCGAVSQPAKTTPTGGGGGTSAAVTVNLLIRIAAAAAG